MACFAATVFIVTVPSWKRWMMLLCRVVDCVTPKGLKKNSYARLELCTWGSHAGTKWLLLTGLPGSIALLIRQSATHQCATNQSCACGSSFENSLHAGDWKIWRLLSSAGASFWTSRWGRWTWEDSAAERQLWMRRGPLWTQCIVRSLFLFGSVWWTLDDLDPSDHPLYLGPGLTRQPCFAAGCPWPLGQPVVFRLVPVAAALSW